MLFRSTRVITLVTAVITLVTGITLVVFVTLVVTLVTAVTYVDGGVVKRPHHNSFGRPPQGLGSDSTLVLGRYSGPLDGG